jgi:PAS domain S-box-containing protein
LQLSGYSLARLRDDGEFALYRASAKEAEPTSVLLITPSSTRPKSDTLKKIKHEYSLRGDLDSAWAARALHLSEENGQVALLLEDPGGEPLDKLLSQGMGMAQSLRLAVALANALSSVHQKNLIHKDVKPANVLADPAAGQVRLMGFGIASRVRREHPSPQSPDFIEGTLPYLAPEQTGRINRSVDTRSDLYGFGVTLYEMLTGDLPFRASDPLEWVHCHIAQQPVPPHERAKDVPASVSAIVMKLLAKTPEDRYQTATGVERDLRLCLSQWEELGTVRDFSLGKHDAPDRLLIPEKLYGREREINTLLSAFDRVVAVGRTELVVVSGYSGIGKSAVVNELHKALVLPRGLFASGKFDQYKRDIPYSTFAQAFQSLTRQLLSKGEEELSKWRDNLNEALASNGQLMIDLVPELKAIIGEQPPVPELPQHEAQHRFHSVFRRFVNVFARKEHPLALFLDDLQWLDAATLNLIEDLLTQPDVEHLLLIGAYRDNEVDSTHPLMRKLDAIRQAGVPVREIVLAPLSRDDLERLVADSLHCEPKHAGTLAESLYDKTNGNPFFAIQFISTLYEEGLLVFDHAKRQWSWDLHRIHAKEYAENVIELMSSKLKRLAPETQDALKQLACLGNTAEFPMLRMVYEDSVERMHSALAEAVEAGFLLRSKDSYRFIHDRVQEAAYSLIPVAIRTEAHLRIGRLLVAHTALQDRERRIFEIVNQLNRGVDHIISREEKEQLAEFNLMAGRRARASTAYVSALSYFAAGAEFLGNEGWSWRPELMFALEFHRAECEFLTGALAEAKARSTLLVPHAAEIVDQAKLACLRIDLYTTLNRSDLAIHVCLSYLRNLGVEWSPHPTQEQARREYERALSLLKEREIEDLIDLPLMSGPTSVATMDVLLRALAPAVYTDSSLLSLLLWRMINLSLEHGNIDASCYAYAHGGGLAGAIFGNFKEGFRFGQLGYDLVEKRGLKRFKAMTYVGYGVLILSWTQHWRIGRELLRSAFDAANDSGDVTYAAYSWHNLISNLIAAGDPLPDTQREAERGLEFVRKIRYDLVIDNISTQLALIRTLRGMTATFGSLTNSEFKEQQIERRLSSDPGMAFAACWYWTRKLQARFFAGDYSAAVDASYNAQRLLWISPCFLESAEAHFYGALSHAAACNSARPTQRRKHLDAVTGHYKQLLSWAEICPENFQNRAALVGAEMARIEGRVLDAEKLYEQAIRSARSNHFLNNEGLAYELAARFYAGRDLTKFADTYLLEARYCYQRWGADGKVAQLEKQYPHLKREPSVLASTGTIVAPTELLDLATVIRVSQAVSGEMVLEKLIESLMRAAVQQAGAERGLLLFPNGNHFQLMAEATTRGNHVKVHHQNDPTNEAKLPESVIRYVVRTHENVILEDVSVQNQFSSDAYLHEHRVRSLLCFPLINQRKLTGVLYLENRLASHAFAPDRVAVLKMLVSQAAASLENTRLYRAIEDRESKIRRLIDANVIGIVIWDLDGTLIDANEAFLRMLGYDRADLQKGLRWFDMTPPDWQAVHARIEAEELKTTGKMQAREKEYFRKDGSRVPVLIGAACFENQPNQGVAYILDLSEQKRAEEALRRSQAYLAEAQRLTHTGSCAIDGASREIVYWSDEMFRLFDFSSEQGPPDWEHFVERIHPDDRNKVKLASERTFRTTSSCDVEFRIVKPDGTIRHIHGFGHPVVAPSGELVRVLGTMVDITERKRAEEVRERVRQLEADLAHTTRVSTMGELTASLAHEIKQPIGAAVTNAEACIRLLDRDQPDLQEAREAAVEMIKDARRAADIIDRVRSLCQKGSSQLQEADLNQMIEEMVVIMDDEANRHAVTIRTDLARGLPLVMADRVQLQQALMNLMRNGIEAMQDMGGELRIKSMLNPENQLLISVSDTGVGLPMENSDKIFNAFFTTKIRGTGLGLAITRSIIQSHGGQIWAVENSGRGATFQFTLPTGKAAA